MTWFATQGLITVVGMIDPRNWLDFRPIWERLPNEMLENNVSFLMALDLFPNDLAHYKNIIKLTWANDQMQSLDLSLNRGRLLIKHLNKKCEFIKGLLSVKPKV